MVSHWRWQWGRRVGARRMKASQRRLCSSSMPTASAVRRWRSSLAASLQVIKTFTASPMTFLVEVSDQPATLFRGNSLDTKMFRYYAILACAPYLWGVLARFVWELQRDGIVNFLH